jgi:hypothetical protein
LNPYELDEKKLKARGSRVTCLLWNQDSTGGFLPFSAAFFS